MSVSTSAGDTLDIAIRFLLRAEGGAVNDPRDPGGPTGAGGVSLRAVRLRDFDRDGTLDFDLDRDGDVDEADMRLVQPDDVRRLALEDYWRPTNAFLMPPRIAIALLDTAWLCGPRVAVALLQRALSLREDGVPGPVTQREARANPEALALFLVRRLAYHAEDPKGWARSGYAKRVLMLAEYCGGIAA